MTSDDILSTCANELNNIRACLQGIENGLYADPQIPKLLLQRDRQSLQALDRVQQELQFISDLLRRIAEQSDTQTTDAAVGFLANSPLRSMAERFETDTRLENTAG